MDESLSNAAKQTQEISKDWPEKRQRCGQVLEALLQLTIDDTEKAEEGFSNIEVHEFVSLNISDWGSSTDDEVSRKVRNAWKDLDALWVRKEKGISQRFEHLGFTNSPIIHKTSGGGGGIVNKYSFRLEPTRKITKEEELPVDVASDKLEYFEDDVDELKGLAGAFASSFLLKGARKWLFLAGMFLVLLSLVLLFFIFSFGISQQESFGQTVRFVGMFVVILWAEWSLFGAFYQVIEQRVQVAPGWLQPWSSENDWLLVFEKNKPKAANAIKLKRYTAKCPTCGGLVRIHKGGFSYSNRLIGRCDNSPREHVFSFDHYLRSGGKVCLAK